MISQARNSSSKRLVDVCSDEACSDVECSDTECSDDVMDKMRIASASRRLEEERTGDSNSCRERLKPDIEIHVTSMFVKRARTNR